MTSRHLFVIGAALAALAIAACKPKGPDHPQTASTAVVTPPAADAATTAQSDAEAAQAASTAASQPVPASSAPASAPASK